MVKLKGISGKTSMRTVSKMKHLNGFQVFFQYGCTHIKRCSFTCHHSRFMRWQVAPFREKRSSDLVMNVKPSKAMPASLELLNEAYDECSKACAEYAKTFNPWVRY
ncbi:hypothetical protein AMTRI_Chr06g201700 [Amborella trichopoda]